MIKPCPSGQGSVIALMALNQLHFMLQTTRLFDLCVQVFRASIGILAHNTSYLVTHVVNSSVVPTLKPVKATMHRAFDQLSS